MATETMRDTPSRSTGALHIALWFVQVALAGMYIMAGTTKAFAPYSELSTNLAWVQQFSPGVVRFLGWLEILGAIGLIIPAATRIQPLLTAWAATGLATMMLCAAVLHLTRNEPQMLPLVLTLGALAAFVAWGRFRKAPIPPRELPRGGGLRPKPD